MTDRGPAVAGDAIVTDAPGPASAAVAAMSVASAALSACGGGGGKPDANPPAGAPPPVPAPAKAIPLAPSEASRFMAQAAFGASPAHIEALGQTGAEPWLQAQFALPLTTPSTFDWMIARGFSAPGYFGSDVGVDSALWSRLMGSPDVLRQRVVFAMSQIFVVSTNGMGTWWGQFGPAAFWDLLEAHCFGNFRTLIERIALSPAMGVYLNMRGSQKADGFRQPDENFARELLQLFTIGLARLNADGTPRTSGGRVLESYTNEDIRELAKVFTGWDLDAPSTFTPQHMNRPMAFDESKHSEGSKQFLGITIPAGTPGKEALKRALDGIVAHANVGPFFGRQLIQHLVTSNPSAAYVGRVAAAFANNGQGVRGDLQAVIRAVLLDPEARPDLSTASAELASTHGKLREPVMRLVQWARLFNVTSPDGGWDVPNLAPRSSLSQSPMRAPSVFNFYRPGYVPPQSAIAERGLHAPEFQITDEASVIAYANFMQLVIVNGNASVKPDYTAWMDLAADPAALVARLNLLLAGGHLSASTQALILSVVAGIDLASVETLYAVPVVPFFPAPIQASGALRRVLMALFLVLCCPDYLVQR